MPMTAALPRLAVVLPARARAAFLVCALACAALPALAVDVRGDLWTANGPVRAIALDESAGLVYLGGDFTQVGPADGSVAPVTRNHLAAFDLATGTVTAWDPGADGAVHALWLAPDGLIIYAGGDFTGIGGQSRKRLAALDTVFGQPLTWAQAIDTAGADGLVRVMVPSAAGNTLYIGGAFSTVANAARRGVAEVGVIGNSGLTGLGQAALFEAGADVRALARGAARLYVGGVFTGIQEEDEDEDDDEEPPVVPQGAIRLAAVDLSTFRFADWFPPVADGEVRALDHVPGQGVVYAGGTFTSIGATAQGGLAAFNATSGSRLAWNPGLAGSVDALARSVDRTMLYAGGEFSAVGGAAASNLAAIAVLDAAPVAEWQVDADGAVIALARNDPANAGAGDEDGDEESDAEDVPPMLYAGGSFDAIDGSPRPRFAALSALPPESAPPATAAVPPGRFFNSNDVGSDGQSCNDPTIPLPPGQPACSVNLAVALLCNDGNGSGCAATYYTLDGSEPGIESPRYVAPISLSVNTVLKFFSVDNVGNAGAVGTEAYTFETDPPRTTVDPPSHVFESDSIEVRLSCTDAGSGCSATYYTLDGSRPTVNSRLYTGPIVIGSDTVLQYFSVDVAGNAEGVQRADYVDDRGEIGAFGARELLLLLAALPVAMARRRRERG